MKVQTDFYFPFTMYAETKESKSGKKYTSISICQHTKDKDGKPLKKYFNLIEKRDLLVLSEMCREAYKNIAFHETQERFEKLPKKSEEQELKEPEQVSDAFDDEIPF